MKRAMGIVLAGAAALVAPAIASPHGGGGGDGACRAGDGRGGGMHGMVGMMDGGGMMGMGGGDSPGAMGAGLGPIWRLELTDVQRKQLTRISDALRRAHWATMGKMIDARARLRDVGAQPQPDPRQVGAAFAEVSKLRQEMLEASVRARNEARGLLTPAQREQLDRRRFGGGAPARDAAPGGADEGTGAGGEERASEGGAGEHEERH
ncbi:MAG TPA: Spy/CpxP family protein refolding chaperone [Anaeromyxobacter sp.]|nr:Spy/CpxP family protein refolding chaperone [Anaeromyxobacter sp.]